MWITDLLQTFSTRGAQLIDKQLTEMSTSEAGMYEMGLRAWKHINDLEGVKFPSGLATTSGAQAGLAFVRGLRHEANNEWQKLMDEISAYREQSSDDGKPSKEAVNSHEATPASKTESSQAKPSDGELFPEG